MTKPKQTGIIKPKRKRVRFTEYQRKGLMEFYEENSKDCAKLVKADYVRVGAQLGLEASSVQSFVNNRRHYDILAGKRPSKRLRNEQSGHTAKPSKKKKLEAAESNGIAVSSSYDAVSCQNTVPVIPQTGQYSSTPPTFGGPNNGQGVYDNHSTIIQSGSPQPTEGYGTMVPPYSHQALSSHGFGDQRFNVYEQNNIQATIGFGGNAAVRPFFNYHTAPVTYGVESHQYYAPQPASEADFLYLSGSSYRGMGVNFGHHSTHTSERFSDAPVDHHFNYNVPYPASSYQYNQPYGIQDNNLLQAPFGVQQSQQQANYAAYQQPENAFVGAYDVQTVMQPHQNNSYMQYWSSVAPQQQQLHNNQVEEYQFRQGAFPNVNPSSPVHMQSGFAVTPSYGPPHDGQWHQFMGHQNSPLYGSVHNGQVGGWAPDQGLHSSITSETAAYPPPEQGHLAATFTEDTTERNRILPAAEGPEKEEPESAFMESFPESTPVFVTDVTETIAHGIPEKEQSEPEWNEVETCDTLDMEQSEPTVSGAEGHKIQSGSELCEMKACGTPAGVSIQYIPATEDAIQELESAFMESLPGTTPIFSIVTEAITHGIPEKEQPESGWNEVGLYDTPEMEQLQSAVSGAEGQSSPVPSATDDSIPYSSPRKGESESELCEMKAPAEATIETSPDVPLTEDAILYESIINEVEVTTSATPEQEQSDSAYSEVTTDNILLATEQDTQFSILEGDQSESVFSVIAPDDSATLSAPVVDTPFSFLEGVQSESVFSMAEVPAYGTQEKEELKSTLNEGSTEDNTIFSAVEEAAYSSSSSSSLLTAVRDDDLSFLNDVFIGESESFTDMWLF
ncbi:unnamed protein product [Hermetia illucens]|uniref:Homeobox domain-containing protein n=1 Tax=Hermetia illucens TaxID=343691 RepID=A0A7R8UME8_HERIL|nr:unnamed protein product [Hermetia illucens]